MFQCPRLIDPPVPPVLKGAGPSKPEVISALIGPVSVKDVMEFVGGFREEVQGPVEALDASVTSQVQLHPPTPASPL